MNAYKENCQKALDNMVSLSEKHVCDIEFMEEFLKAALKKLPSEAAYQKEKDKKKKNIKRK